MADGERPRVTICMAHWQVRELVTVCLRAIRRFTPAGLYEVIVVDNGSKDDSLDYLRSVEWIRLIERGAPTREKWVESFTTALDVGRAEARGEFFLVMHTDTIVHRAGWLERLIRPMEERATCASVGAWKLEMVNPWYAALKKATDTKEARLWLKRTLLRDEKARSLQRELCPRDYCTLFRLAPIQEHGLKFGPDGRYPGYTTGEKMYYQLKEVGYDAEVIETREMLEYMEHVAHATAGLRPGERRLGHRRSQRKVERRLRRFWNRPLVKELQAAAELDRS